MRGSSPRSTSTATSTTRSTWRRWRKSRGSPISSRPSTCPTPPRCSGAKGRRAREVDRRRTAQDGMTQRNPEGDIDALRRAVQDYERRFLLLDDHLRLLERERQKLS